mgnify:CR=1 FL=1
MQNSSNLKLSSVAQWTSQKLSAVFLESHFDIWPMYNLPHCFCCYPLFKRDYSRLRHIFKYIESTEGDLCSTLSLAVSWSETIQPRTMFCRKNTSGFFRFPQHSPQHIGVQTARFEWGIKEDHSLPFEEPHFIERLWRRWMNQLQHQLFNDLVEELPLKEARIHEFMFQCRHSLQKPPIIFFFATKKSPRKFIFKLLQI